MEKILDKVVIRHFKDSDLKEFEASANRNADWIGEYLPEGSVYKGFTTFEYFVVFKSYVSNTGGYEFFGAFLGDYLVGMIIACPASTEIGVQLIYWVAKEFVNMGIATKMIKEVSEIQFKKGYWNIECHTDASNSASQVLMKKCDFVIADKYESELHGTKSTGNMIAWIKYSPYPRSPLGPRKSPLDILRPRQFHLPF
jgi:RimJ/RimL family protein N-acetyltransferase